MSSKKNSENFPKFICENDRLELWSEDLSSHICEFLENFSELFYDDII